jgi:hypothetical protein
VFIDLRFNKAGRPLDQARASSTACQGALRAETAETSTRSRGMNLDTSS